MPPRTKNIADRSAALALALALPAHRPGPARIDPSAGLWRAGDAGAGAGNQRQPPPAASRRPTAPVDRGLGGRNRRICSHGTGRDDRRPSPVPQVEYPALRTARSAHGRDARSRRSRLRHTAVGRGERQGAGNIDAADGHAAGIALGAYWPSQRAARQGARARSTSIRPTGRPSAHGCCFGWAKPMPRGCSSPASIPTASPPRCTRSRCSRRWPAAILRRCARSKARLAKIEPRVAPLVTAICASLSGESERAAADIEAARRRGRLGGIDLALADKVVGAGAETSRAVTIEWEPVDG